MPVSEPPVDSPATREERFRLLVDQVTEYAIFLLDASGNVTSWNAGAERIKGYRAEEIIGQHFSKFYRPEDTWKCEHELTVATREGRVEDEGFRVRKDGSLFWANVVITCLRDAAGSVVGYGKVTRDLTERRRTEEILRASEERFRLLVENVKDYAIFMLDPQGFVASWNVGAERIKGYQPREIIGQHFSRFYPQEDVQAGKCEMELERASDDGRFEDEGYRIRKDGTPFWANVVITALRNASGQLIGFAKVTRDLTERRAAEAERLRLGQQARERIHSLAKLSETLASALSLDEVARATVDRGTSFVGADTCTLYRLAEASGTLHLLAEHGLSASLVERLRTLAAGHDAALLAVGKGASEGLWIESADDYAKLLPALAKVTVDGPPPQAFACVPLFVQGRSIGMLALGFSAPQAFSDDDREFVKTFGRQCAQALERAERVHAERAAAARAENLGASLSTTLRSIGDAVIATDADGMIRLMNGVAETLTGFREEEARGKPLREVFHIVNEQTRETVPSPVVKVLESGGIIGLANHTLLIARDGREIAIDDSGAPIRADNGAIEGVVLVFRDVSERKAEETRRTFLMEATIALTESLEYEQTVGRVAHLAVPLLADWCAVDLVVEGSAHPKRIAIAHVDPSRIPLVQEFDRRYPPPLEADRGVPRVLRSGRSELYPEITEEMLQRRCVDAEHLRLARELRLSSALVVPLKLRGRVFGAMSFIYAESGRHYTERDLAFAEELARRCGSAIENARLYRSEREAREAADVANRAKDEFLAVVSHELRTPLNAIMGWSKMLGRPDFDERRRATAIETISRNAVAMAQLIEDLLDTSRVISGKLGLQLQKVDIARVIGTALDSVRPAAGGRGVELSVKLAEDAPAIYGDPTRLQQVVWNLLSNAIKFSARGSNVQVTLEALPSEVRIEVADGGQGIDPSFLPHVFELFRQQDASSSRVHGGLGLGLAISKQLVELHGGKISARSEGVGRGASFTVTLPVGSAAAGGSAIGRARRLDGESSFRAPPHLRGLHVLVVDDDDDARHLTASILEDCGCEVVTAGSAAQALGKIAERVPDLLLSDIGMPGEDGYELIRQVRALPRERGGDVPAAAITAFARPEDRRRMLNAGYSIHLPKPVEPGELVAVVSTLSRFIQR